MLNGKWRRRIERRKIALCASATGIAVAIGGGMTALPSSASATVGSAIPASAIPALRTAMLDLAQRSGDAHPISIRAVSTTQAKALVVATPGDTVPGSAHRPAYLVVMTGKFKLNVSVPPHASLPTGRYLSVTVNPSTFKIMDLGLSKHASSVPLRKYGPVSTLNGHR
jgi:hypothetical protein